MKPLHTITAALVIVGALNWGVIATTGIDLVATLFGMRFGEVSPLSAVVYGLVGLSALYQALVLTRGRAAVPVTQHAR